MKEMLDLAEGKSDKAEIFSLEEKTDIIRFENFKLKDIETKIQSGVSLRIQKNGKLGFAYTKNLYDREGLLNNALSSLTGGVEASFDFPSTKKSSVLNTFDPSVKDISNSDIVAECRRVSECLSSEIKGQLDIFAALDTSELSIMNSSGTDLKEKFSSYSLSLNVFYPGSSSGIQRSLIGKNFKRTDKKYLNYIINT